MEGNYIEFSLTTVQVICMEILLLAVCEFSPLSSFLSRKLCHCGSGILMLQLDPSDPLARYFVYSVVVSSLIMVWEMVPFQFRYSERRDIGISIYLIIVCLFFYFQLPLHIVRPIFFADPMGAIVGKTLTNNHIYNPVWINNKTVGGSFAVFFTCYLSLTFGDALQRLFLSVFVALGEGLSSKYDNLLITLVVIIGYELLES